MVGLKQYLELTDEESVQLQNIIKKYPLRVTPYYLGLIDKADKNDPIRKLCIPEIMEYSEGGQEDTSGEHENTVVKGMQHKYRQTVLILSTKSCAVYCRHCFRKRLVGAKDDEIADDLEAMAEYVKSHKEIKNVLISGGDAFANENDRIEEYLETFSAIENVELIRLGTRVPVVMPERIYEDRELLDILERYNKKTQLMVVTQFNHPRELTGEAKRGVSELLKLGVNVRNQTVLLKGVNDLPQILAELMNGLVSTGVIPYYVFQCRPVLGVKNQFQVPIARGEEILKKAATMMSGQAKSFRYVLSHPSGKIEILGSFEGEMLFKYHQAKAEKDRGRMFKVRLKEDQCWLNDSDITG